jgi:hypothetical protein
MKYLSSGKVNAIQDVLFQKKAEYERVNYTIQNIVWEV